MRRRRESPIKGNLVVQCPISFQLFSFLWICNGNKFRFCLDFGVLRFDSSCHANGALNGAQSHTQQNSLLSKQSMQVQGFVCLIVRTFSFYLFVFGFSPLSPDKDSLTIYTDLVVPNCPLTWVRLSPVGVFRCFLYPGALWSRWRTGMNLRVKQDTVEVEWDGMNRDERKKSWQSRGATKRWLKTSGAVRENEPCVWLF